MHHFDSTSDHVPQNLSQVGWVKLCKAATVCQWTAYQCAQILCICLIWIWEVVWGGCQPQPWHNHIIFDSTSDPEPQNLTHVVWVYNCVRLILYAHGHHINVFHHFVYVQYGFWKQFEVAVSLNHDIITSFQLNKWHRTPKSEARSRVGITV